MIPESAVEAVARKLFQSTMDEPWEAAYPAQEEHFRDRARGILKGAAPFMLRSAYDLGFSHGSAEPANPYRSQA